MMKKTKIVAYFIKSRLKQWKKYSSASVLVKIQLYRHQC